MIQLETSPTTTTITVVGDLDLAERDQFPEVAARVSGLRRQLLVVDMCRTTFLDSTGAAFLISLADLLGRRGGVTVLRGADQRDLFVLEVCGALEMFRIDEEHRCDDLDAVGPWRVERQERPRGA
jgi:anti-anti-sigma factor